MPLSCHERIKITKQTSFEKKTPLCIHLQIEPFCIQKRLVEKPFYSCAQNVLITRYELDGFRFHCRSRWNVAVYVQGKYNIKQITFPLKTIPSTENFIVFFICSEARGMFECSCAALTFSIDDLIRGRNVWLVHSQKNYFQL